MSFQQGLAKCPPVLVGSNRVSWGNMSQLFMDLIFSNAIVVLIPGFSTMLPLSRSIPIGVKRMDYSGVNLISCIYAIGCSVQLAI